MKVAFYCDCSSMPTAMALLISEDGGFCHSSMPYSASPGTENSLCKCYDKGVHFFWTCLFTQVRQPVCGVSSSRVSIIHSVKSRTPTIVTVIQ